MGVQLRDIRRAVALGLRTGGQDPAAPVIPQVGARVYAGRTTPFDAKELPAVNVTTDRDRVDAMRVDSPPEYWRICTLAFEVVVKGHPDPGVHDGLETDELDEIGQSIEDFMGTIELPKVWECELRTFQSQVKFEGNKPFVVGVWEYSLKYPELMPREPDLSSLVPFETLMADWDLANTSGDLEAQDQVEIPQ